MSSSEAAPHRELFARIQAEWYRTRTQAEHRMRDDPPDCLSCVRSAFTEYAETSADLPGNHRETAAGVETFAHPLHDQGSRGRALEVGNVPFQLLHRFG